jgi:serine/threonine protein kinase
MNADDPDADFDNDDMFDFGQGDSDEDEDADPFADIFEADVVIDHSEDENVKKMPGMAHRGTFVGTPLYASPEMLTNSVSGPFTDLWALGVIVYQLLTGKVPFEGQ